MLDRPNNIGTVTLGDRLEYGRLSVDETCALKNCSRSQFYRDLKDGLVTIVKDGKKSSVLGPEAKRYAST
jgi:hypothetical protein